MDHRTKRPDSHARKEWVAVSYVCGLFQRLHWGISPLLERCGDCYRTIWQDHTATAISCFYPWNL